MAPPRIALITTTIFVPKVIRLFHALDEHVTLFIAGDKKTPHDEVRAFLRDIPAARYLSVSDQEGMQTRSSEVIGWNKIMRRNLALLAAMESGADVIVTVDDDNLPCDRDYFNDLRRLFVQPFCGLEVRAESGFFDIGPLLGPKLYHRGFPYPQRHKDPGLRFSPVTGRNVGVAEGLVMGDPDIDAMQRITNAPFLTDVPEIFRNGFTVDPASVTVFNTQNTAVAQRFAPLIMVLCGVGRYDDIFASYLCQRVMREYGAAVHFGKPFVWQERNQQNLFRNLQDEMFGMEYTPRLISDLNAIDIGKGSVLEQLGRLYQGLKPKGYLPEIVFTLGEAWIHDAEKAMNRAARAG